MCKRGEINRSCGRAVRLLFKASCAELFRSGQTERVTRVTLIPEESTSVELKFLSWLIGEQSYLSNLVSKPWVGRGTDRSPNLFRHTHCASTLRNRLDRFDITVREISNYHRFPPRRIRDRRVAISLSFFLFPPDKSIFSRSIEQFLSSSRKRSSIYRSSPLCATSRLLKRK